MICSLVNEQLIGDKFKLISNMENAVARKRANKTLGLSFTEYKRSNSISEVDT